MPEFFKPEVCKYSYIAFGLKIASDLPFKELNFANESAAAAEVIIYAGEIIPPQNRDPFPALWFDGKEQELLLDIRGVGRLLVREGREIIYDRAEGLDDDTLGLFLLGCCMAVILQQRGYIVMHGSALSMDKKHCTIFVGHSGAGKSTTAAHYFQQGAYILTDDVCAIYFDEHGKPMVVPGYPQLKLWQDAADLLGISTKGLRRVRKQEMKYGYRIEAQRFCSQALPLKNIVELEPGDAKRMTGFEKLKRLICHSYRYGFLQRMGLCNQYGKKLLNLINQVEVEAMDRVSAQQRLLTK